MDAQVAEKVCAIREKVATLIGPNRYRTWFGEPTELGLAGDCLDVTVANDFVGAWITSNFMSHLREAARAIVGGEPRVRVRVQPPAGGGPQLAPQCAAERGPAAAPPLRRGPDRPALRGELAAFVVGPSNELAFSVAQTVVRHPGQAFKHVVLHGGCGLGKTHLLQGICNGVRRAHADLNWHYLSGEEFTNEFIYAVKHGRIDLFRARFRSVDLLVIDDIHFLANKRATQDEFLHTFNAIDAGGKVVVLSTDAHPRSIQALSEPLRDRLIACMVVRIHPPDYATRREILHRRARALDCELPGEVLDYLARHVTRNVRELEGALYKLVAYASLTRTPVSAELAQRVIHDYVVRSRTPGPAEIEQVVAEHFGLAREALRSGSRDRLITLARGLTMYLVRKHTRLSFPEIGRALGDKRHSTVLMATRRIQDLLDRNGAVTWKTPSGLRDVPARALLEELERRLPRGQDAS